LVLDKHLLWLYPKPSHLGNNVSGAPLGWDDDHVWGLRFQLLWADNLLANAGNIGANFVWIGIDNPGKPIGLNPKVVHEGCPFPRASPEGNSQATVSQLLKLGSNFAASLLAALLKFGCCFSPEPPG
jgi:hypothetical protein